MNLICIKKVFCTAASTVLFALSVPISASADNQHQKGVIGPYDYMMWNQDGIGEVEFEPAFASFICSWEDTENCVFSIGKNFDNKKKDYEQLSANERSIIYDVEYEPKGSSFIGIHGWTRNPLLEYYIVEGSVDWGLPPQNNDHGSYCINGKTYNLYKQMIYNQPSIEGTATFPRYWSVCTDNCAKKYQTNYIKDSVDFYRHFEAWDKLGVDMSGTVYEACLYIENFRSSGSANVKSVNFSSYGSAAAQILRYGPYVTNPRLSFVDSAGYRYIYYFDSDKIIDWASYDECALSISKNGYSGTYGDNCILVSDRIEEWDGIVLPISNNFTSGDTLSFGAAVMQDTEEAVDFVLTVMYEDEDGITQFDEAAVASAKKGEWTDLSTVSYTIPENAYNTTIRIETKESNTDFHFDNAYVAEDGVQSYINKLIKDQKAMEGEKGDLNMDGVVDIFDIIHLRKIVFDVFMGEKCYLYSGDVNGDGIVNIADLVRLQKFMLGTENTETT